MSTPRKKSDFVRLPKAMDLSRLIRKHGLHNKDLLDLIGAKSPGTVSKVLRGDQGILKERVKPLAQYLEAKCGTDVSASTILHGIMETDGSDTEPADDVGIFRDRAAVFKRVNERMKELNASRTSYDLTCLLYDGALVTGILGDERDNSLSELLLGKSWLKTIRTVRISEHVCSALDGAALLKKDLSRELARNLDRLANVRVSTETGQVSVPLVQRQHVGLPEAFAVMVDGLIAFGEPFVAHDGTLRTAQTLGIWSQARHPEQYAEYKAKIEAIVGRSRPLEL